MKHCLIFFKLLSFMILLGNLQSDILCSPISYGNIDLATSTFHFDQSGSYSFQNNVNYPYTPVNVTSSIPAVKITASNIVIDFNNIGLVNTDTTHSGWIGIEIGWSPQELIDDPTRVQPTNIKLLNCSLTNFDCGLIIHKHVNRVVISKVNFADCSMGILALGTSTDMIQNIEIRNIDMVGHLQNYHAALVNLKTRIETTYGYGANYFMPLVADPYNSNTVDVYSYFGMWLNNVIKLTLNNVNIQKIGYDDSVGGTAGNGFRTQAIACAIRNSRNIDADNFNCFESHSEIKAVGLQLDNCSSIGISNSKYSYHTSGKRAVGIEITNDTAAAYSVVAMTLNNVFARYSTSTEVAIGMDLSSTRGLAAYHLTTKFNNGGLQGYGIYMKSGYTIDIQDSTFCENAATRQTNDQTTEFGIAAFGFYGENVNSMQQARNDLCSMQGLNSAYGMYLKNCSSCRFDTCQFVANAATSMRSGEAADIRSQQDAQEISKHAPIVTAAHTGGYGAMLVNTNVVKFEDCLANTNTGHRAIGLCFNTCRSVAIYKTFASAQYATGQMLDSSFLTDNAATPHAIPIQSIHRPLLFGNLTKTTVDAIATTDLFLEKIALIRAAQLADTVPAYADVIAMMATSSLLQSMIARYRIWSVGMGIHAYNVTGFLLNDCTCVGNISLFDSGVGVCFSGRNTDHTLRNSNMAFNVGNLSSVITPATSPATYAYKYNLMGMKSFWSVLLGGNPWSQIENAAIGSDALAIAFSPDGTLLAVGTANDTVEIWNTSTWTLAQTLTGHTASVVSLAFSPDGTLLASGSGDVSNNIKIWNTTTWTNTQTLNSHTQQVNALAFSPDATLLASGSNDDSVKIWNTTTWAVSQTLTGINADVTSVAFNPAGTLLASASAATSNNIKIWQVSDWSNTQTLNVHTARVNSVAFNPAGTLLASGSDDALIKIWNTTSWTVSQTLTASAGNVNAVAFKNDGKLLASAHGNNSVQVWKTTSWGSLEHSFTDHTGAVTALAWSSDGRKLATCSIDDSARVYLTNIFRQAATVNDVGIYNAGPYFTMQGQKTFGDNTQGDDVFIRLKSVDRALVSPVGPMGAGVIMGDMLLEGVVENCKLYGNLGNGGHTYGALLDHDFSVTLDSNLISGNIANIYGVSVGVMDITAHTPNLYLRNFLEGNKCSTYNNGNYLIPFNPADPNALTFQVRSMYNGRYTTAVTEFDNISVEYSQSPEFYDIEYLQSTPQHPDLITYLNTHGCWQ